MLGPGDGAVRGFGVATARHGAPLHWPPSLHPSLPSMKTYDPVPSRRVAFLGLGVMGHPMASHLARAGHQVTVYNRSPAKAQAWRPK